MNPVVAVILGWLLLGEAIGPRELVAGGVIVVGVALIVLSATRAPKAEPAPELAPSSA